jgi:hypothetical protein
VRTEHPALQGLPGSGRRQLGVAAGAAALAAALSLLIVPAAPSYDAWSWLIWGRELAGLELSTAEGPAWKPLPAFACAALAVFGDAAPTLWVVLVRFAALLALVFAWVLARGRVGGAAAALGVLLTGSFVSLSLRGDSEAVLLAFALGAALLALRDRVGWAVVCLACAALIRVETWPFLVGLGAWYAWRHPRWRWPFVGIAAGVLALWFVPEWLGSGELLRSADRAQIPNPGQPATADFPFAASLGDALPIVFWPVAVFAVLRPRLAAVGAAWILLVALMAQAGFSGEARYAVPGAALLAVAGGIALSEQRREVLAMAAVLSLALALPRIGDWPRVRDNAVYAADLHEDLRRAVDAGGGPDALLACGRPYVGHRRGPMLAYALRVEKKRVAFEPRTPGVVFRSRLTGDARVEPALPASGYRRSVSLGGWEIHRACG